MNFPIITKSNSSMFNKNIKNCPSIVFILAEWCGHCKTLKPHINNIKKELHNNSTKANIITVDSEALPDISSHHTNNIEGFPEIFFIDENDNKHDYDRGSREYSDLKNFIIEKLKLQQMGGAKRKIKTKKHKNKNKKNKRKTMKSKYKIKKTRVKRLRFKNKSKKHRPI